jgi:hypothetical protein
LTVQLTISRSVDGTTSVVKDARLITYEPHTMSGRNAELKELVRMKNVKLSLCFFN